MSRLFRTASFAATSFCALAAMGAIPVDPAIGAPLFPPTVSESLPSIPVIESRAADGIVPPPATTALPSASSLAALVTQHANEAPGDREADCLANAVYFEAKGEPLDGQLAVAQVILNRAKSGRFATTLCGVVKQKSQFSFVRGGAFPAIASQPMWRRAVAIAHIAMDGLWSSPAPDALYFHARRVSPNWSRQRVAAVGNHIFYR